MKETITMSGWERRRAWVLSHAEAGELGWPTQPGSWACQGAACAACERIYRGRPAGGLYGGGGGGSGAQINSCTTKPGGIGAAGLVIIECR